MNAIAFQKEENVFKTKSWIYPMGLVIAALSLFIGMTRLDGNSLMVLIGLVVLVTTLDRENSRKIEVLKRLLEDKQPRL